VSVADFHSKAECWGRSGTSAAVIDAPLHSVLNDALRAAVEWSIRELPDFRLREKALDLVDQCGGEVSDVDAAEEEEFRRRDAT
jgi:hypothetical protein